MRAFGSKHSASSKTISKSDSDAWMLVAIVVLSVLLAASLSYLVYSNWNRIRSLFRPRYASGTEKFDNYSSGDPQMVLYIFLMQGCGWCDKIKGEVAALQNIAMTDHNFGKLVDVRVLNFPTNDSSELQLGRDFDVQGFPAIVLSKKDQSKFWKYHNTSERTAASIKQWAMELANK